MVRRRKPIWRHKTRRKMMMWAKQLAVVEADEASSPRQVRLHFRATAVVIARRTRMSLARELAVVEADEASSPLQVRLHFRAIAVVTVRRTRSSKCTLSDPCNKNRKWYGDTTMILCKT